jgi:hypothetical protein
MARRPMRSTRPTTHRTTPRSRHLVDRTPSRHWTCPRHLRAGWDGLGSPDDELGGLLSTGTCGPRHPAWLPGDIAVLTGWCSPVPMRVGCWQVRVWDHCARPIPEPSCRVRQMINSRNGNGTHCRLPLAVLALQSLDVLVVDTNVSLPPREPFPSHSSYPHLFLSCYPSYTQKPHL